MHAPKRFFINKNNKNIQRKSRMKCFVHSRVWRHSLTLDSKLCNFITSWELIKTPQNFLQDSFSIKSLKLCYKNGVSFWPQGPFKKDIKYWLSARLHYQKLTLSIFGGLLFNCYEENLWTASVLYNKGMERNFLSFINSFFYFIQFL